MKTILCNDCGEVMTRFLNKCKACSRDNFTFYAYPDDPELKSRIAQIKGSPEDGLTRLMYASLVLGVLSVVVYGYYQSVEVQMALMEKNKPVQTASTETLQAQ